MYKIWCPAWDETEDLDGNIIVAPDPLEAAEEWAEKVDQGDYTIANSGSTEVLVKDVEGGRVYEVTIYAEPSITYMATLDRKEG